MCSLRPSLRSLVVVQAPVDGSYRSTVRSAVSSSAFPPTTNTFALLNKDAVCEVDATLERLISAYAEDRHDSEIKSFI